MEDLPSDFDHGAFHRAIDFQRAMCAGTGLTREPNPRSQKFAEDIDSGAFAQSGLADVVTRLCENQRRLARLAHMPVSFFNYGRKFQEIYAKLCAEQGISDTDDEFDEKMMERWNVGVGLRKWMLGLVRNQSTIGRITSYGDVAGFASLNEAEESKASIEIFGGSLLIQAWTVFESLSEDLWESALNFHPGTLAALSEKSRISFNDLQANSFDLRGKMGTILKESSVVGFRSLSAIQASYQLAFSRQGKSIQDVLSDPGLRYAAAVRNLLIHKGGVVDAEFIEQTAGIANVPATAIGDKFPLTGAICEELADSCRTCAQWLVNAVHAWIIGHK
jgi:hypothetical protein